MRAGALATASLLLALACRSVKPGTPVAPLAPSTPEQVLAELMRRATDFQVARSLMRVRVFDGQKTQSFSAQLILERGNSLEMIVYTPIGTKAATIRADGERVSYANHLSNASIEVAATDVARRFGLLDTGITPAEVGLLVIGLPPRADLQYEVTPTGLRSAAVADVRLLYEPPVFPPRQVTITRGANVVEIEHTEIVTTP